MGVVAPQQRRLVSRGAVVKPPVSPSPASLPGPFAFSDPGEEDYGDTGPTSRVPQEFNPWRHGTHELEAWRVEPHEGGLARANRDRLWRGRGWSGHRHVSDTSLIMLLQRFVHWQHLIYLGGAAQESSDLPRCGIGHSAGVAGRHAHAGAHVRPHARTRVCDGRHGKNRGAH